MSWNRIKILNELNRKRLPKGVEKAIFERPQLAIDNLVDFLQSEKPTDYQIVNILFLFPRLCKIKDVNFDSQKIYELSLSYLKHPSDIVKLAASKSVVFQAMTSLVYQGLKLPIADIINALDLIKKDHPQAEFELSAVIKYINELIKKRNCV